MPTSFLHSISFSSPTQSFYSNLIALTSSFIITFSFALKGTSIYLTLSSSIWIISFAICAIFHLWFLKATFLFFRSTPSSFFRAHFFSPIFSSLFLFQKTSLSPYLPVSF